MSELGFGLRKLVLGFIKFDFDLHKVRGDTFDNPQGRIFKLTKVEVSIKLSEEL